jgi:hypothetical protein
MAVEEQITEELNAYFSKVEAAFKLRKDPRTLDRWFALGIGPPVTLISGRRYYNKKAFLRWLVERNKKPAKRSAKAVRG